MSVLIIFIKLIAVFDLLVIAVYFGGDILSTMLNKLRRKAKQEDSFDFSQDAVMVSLSIDSVRQLYSGDAADFVEDKILPNAEKTMAVLTDQEQAAARLLLSALIGFLAAEAPMDEQSFPMVMELLNCMEGEKEDGCQDAVESLLEDAVRNTHRHEEYYSNYQRYQLMQVDKTRVILACRIIINDLLGKLYRYDYRFGYNLLLDEENSIEKKLHTPVREEWEVEAVSYTHLDVYKRQYQTNNFYAVLKRQEMLDKEVYDIVHRNKKMAASDVRKNRGKNCAAGKDKEKTVPRR